MNLNFEVFIIGGGINGAGIARDSAGRGLKVGLAEKGKVGSATSSWSTKLIHGGLRYLENYEFRLVRESLKERNIIRNIAPSITSPLPFIIPHTSKLRPIWLIKVGLYIYNLLAGKNSLPKSSKINIQKEYPEILKEEYRVGFKYFDLQVDDKKLVELNINDAKNRGAKIFENTEVIKTIRKKDYWEIHLSDDSIFTSKIIINATGPWINNVSKKILDINSSNSIRLIQGSHLITKRLYKEDVAFTLQNIDKRIIFIIPYKKKYTLIGTTEIEVNDPNNPKIKKSEIDYLLNCVNIYLKYPINKSNIVSTYSGIRPLIEDFKNNTSKITRDYAFEINTDNNLAPVLSIFGGKLTTYRKLSDRVMFSLKEYFPKMSKPWTHKNKL